MSHHQFELAGTKTINRLGLGAMRITRDPAEGRRILRRAVELGVNFIDTADAYGPEVSERLIGETLSPYPDELVVATKGGLTRSGADGRPEHLRAACEASLKRLGVDRIDLYQLHTVDRRVPFEESVAALKSLQDEGKVCWVGLSNVGTAQLDRARSIVDVVSVQNRYNIGDRASEDVLEMCERAGIAFLPWFPIGNGALARRGGALEHLAEEHSATPAQISLAWLLRYSSVMVPIPGTSSVTHLAENVAAGAIELNDDDMKRIEDAAR